MFVLKILIAEDDRDIRDLIRLGLGTRHELVLTANGKEAVDAARENSFDLIMLDMRMPELDGTGAATQIRDLPGHLTTPILFLSGNVDHKPAVTYSAVMEKPFTLRELAARVETLGKH